MAILYYPNRTVKGSIHPIEQDMRKRTQLVKRGSTYAGENPLAVTISANSDWQINSVAFTFNNTKSRTYNFSIQNGRKVLTNLNDYLWFHLDTTSPQKITLAEGFYTGTQLAAELASKLDANTVYSGKSITFTVTYNNEDGLFVITPSSGQFVI